MAHSLPPALRTPEVAQVRGEEGRGGRDREDGDRLTDLKREIFNAVEKVPEFFFSFLKQAFLYFRNLASRAE